MSRQYVHCSVSLNVRPSLAGRGEEKQERKVCLSSLSSLGFSLLCSPFTLRSASVSLRYVAFMLSLYLYRFSRLFSKRNHKKPDRSLIPNRVDFRSLCRTGKTFLHFSGERRQARCRCWYLCRRRVSPQTWYWSILASPEKRGNKGPFCMRPLSPVSWKHRNNDGRSRIERDRAEDRGWRKEDQSWWTQDQSGWT